MGYSVAKDEWISFREHMDEIEAIPESVSGVLDLEGFLRDCESGIVPELERGE